MKISDHTDNLPAPIEITLGGRAFWRFVDGTTVPVIRGGDGPVGDPAPQPTPPAPAPEPKPEPAPAPNPLGLTPEQQAEVGRIAAREKAEGKRAAEAAMAEQLGCTVEEAKALIAQAKAAEEAGKSELQKATDAANAAKAEADKATATAAQERHEAKLERALLKAGVADDKLGRAIRLVDLKVGASDEEITTEIEAVKAEMPEIFAAPGTKPVAPSSNPTTNPPRSQPGKSAWEAGEERARKRFPQLVPSKTA